jgi:hypothetical protein
MSADELRELGADIKKRGLTSPITLWEARDGKISLLDGRNRLDAIEASAVEYRSSPRGAYGSWVILDGDGKMINHANTGHTVQVLTEEYDDDDDTYVDEHPYTHVISANIQRRHLTAEQKRELIATLIKAQPEKSNRQIAKTVKADDKTVGSVRRELERRAEVPHVETRTDTKGRQQPARKTSAPKPAPAPKATVVPAPIEPTAPDPIALDEEVALLREFARFIIGRAKSVSVDPWDLPEWKMLRDRVKQVLGPEPPSSAPERTPSIISDPRKQKEAEQARATEAAK